MNRRLLIDGIVQQTTILIAQLSTTAGARSPLAHVADQVFLDLSQEIEGQGVRKKVVADMFGLALRSYQKKVQRLLQSASIRDRTLWEAVLSVVEAEQPNRARLRDRFRSDGEPAVTAVLNDLLESGIVFTTGTGQGAVFGVTTDAMRQRIQDEQDLESVANWVWVKVFRGTITRREELSTAVPVARALLDRAVADLLASGRLVEENGVLRSTNFVVPLGSDEGWEAAILDHFRAVALAIASKVRSGAQGSNKSDRIGGSTFTFNLVPGHPFETEIVGLLQRLRAELQALWDRSAKYNEDHPPDPALASKVTFYLGQTLEEREEE